MYGKKPQVLMGVVLVLLFCAMPVLADEVIAKLILDKSTVVDIQRKYGASDYFAQPVYASLVVENLSDKVQQVNLKPTYSFSMIRAGGINHSGDLEFDEFGRSIVLTGSLNSVFKPEQTSLSVAPHTIMLIAYIPITSLESRHTYKAYLGFGGYIISVVIPEGLLGAETTQATEATLVLVKSVQK